MPNITPNTSLLFHHKTFPSVTVPANKKVMVPEWVMRTGTFSIHRRAGNIAVDEPAASDPPTPQPVPRSHKNGARLKPAPPSEE